MKAKQTTIQIEIEETICGADLILLDKHGRTLESLNRQERLLWQILNGKAEDWLNTTRSIDMKDPGDGYAEWHKKFAERLMRVCANRAQVPTKVRVVKSFPDGSPRVLAVTAFWSRKVKKTTDIFDDCNGIWTLREFRKGRKLPKILSRFQDSRLCEWGDMRGYLPSDVDQGELIVECDGPADVLVMSKDDEERHWTFTHQKKL